MVRKRSNQLLLEAAIIAFLLILLMVGGTLTSLQIPASWSQALNPNSVNTNHDPNALALYYNTTLSWLGTGYFDNVSFSIETFPFVNIAPSLNNIARTANSQMSSINISVPAALLDFNQSEYWISIKAFSNASASILHGCAAVSQANHNYSLFVSSTTLSFSALGVPVKLYSVGSSLVEGEISTLLSECLQLKNSISSMYQTNSTAPSLNFAIWSPQTEIVTGGPVTLNGNLSINHKGVSGESVSFYLNGTLLGNAKTDSHGITNVSFEIPFIYSSEAVIWAYAPSNSTISFPGVTSNYLYFAIVFNQTAIKLKDPLTYLPTANFTVEGNLTTISGLPLPNAPVKISFINDTSFTTTDEEGTFTSMLTVPADAQNGIYDVYASFSPQGLFGPSFNFTTIQVTHLLLNVSVQSPELSWAGFYTQVSGTLVANNLGVDGARVSIISPWKVYTTTSGSGGAFSSKILVPFWELAFSKNLSVEISPSQPYVQGATVSHLLGLFNLLFVVIPGVIFGFCVYEINSLGLFSLLKTRLRLRGRKREMSRGPMSSSVKQTAKQKPAASLIPQKVQVPEIIAIYKQALAFAAEELDLSIRESSTIREIISNVSKADSGQGSKLFSAILLTLEDYFYAKKFDNRRVDILQDMVLELKEIWK